MLHYYQQAELARLQHEARLAEAEQARRFAHLRAQRTFRLPAWLPRLGELRWAGFAPQQPVTNEGIAAVRQQAC